MSKFARSLEVTDEEGPPETPAAPEAPKKPEKGWKPAPQAKETGEDAPPRRAKPAKPPAADGTDFVEITDDALKARFNRLYRTTKEAQERATKTEKSLALLAEQNKKLFDAVQKLSTEQKDKSTREEVTKLRQEAKDAFASGDVEAFTEVNERLVEIKTEAATKAKTPDPDEDDDKEKGEEPPAITEAEFTILQRWQGAKSESGKPLRPWAVPGHPEFETTQDVMRRVSARADMAEASVREILAEVDSRMRKLLADSDEESEDQDQDEDRDEEEDLPPVRRAFAPPSGRPVTRRRDQPLTDQEKAIAEQMFTGGRGAPAKNAKEAHDLYLKQKIALARVVAVED